MNPQGRQAAAIGPIPEQIPVPDIQYPNNLYLTFKIPYITYKTYIHFCMRLM
jgi:hypothetical protein